MLLESSSGTFSGTSSGTSSGTCQGHQKPSPDTTDRDYIAMPDTVASVSITGSLFSSYNLFCWSFASRLLVVWWVLLFCFAWHACYMAYGVFFSLLFGNFLLCCFARHARYMAYGVSVIAVVCHFLLFYFAWHARYMAYGVFFSLFLSTFCYFALPSMHATWPTAFFSRCF